MIKTKLNNIPQELKNLDNWLVWKLEPNEDPTKKDKKVPKNIQNYEIKIDATKIENCTNYSNVVSMLDNNNNFDGIGFSIQEKDKLVFIDLDNCIDNKYGIADWAKYWVRYYNSYTEISQSGKGIHIIVKCDMDIFTGKNIGNYEIYNNDHYFALTGNIIEGTEDSLMESHSIRLIENNKQIKTIKESDVNYFIDEINKIKIDNKKNDKLLKILKKNNQFVKLFNGYTESYTSESEADYALTCIIAESTRDKEQILNIIKESKLYDDKWTREDYINSTIDRALQETELKEEIVLDKKFDDLNTCEYLFEKELKPMEWLINTLIPEGLTILCGASKIGKSWMVLEMALGISSGTSVFDIDVNEHSVLYLALEDTERRLRDRIQKLGYTKPPKNFYYMTKWEKIGNGCIEHLNYCLSKHQDIKFVIIDTLAKIQPEKTGKNLYKHDYETISKIKEIADKFGISIVVLHHSRKSSSNDGNDIFEKVSGTTGLMAASDTTIILERGRTLNSGTLKITGRDVEEETLSVDFNNDTCEWTIIGDYVQPKTVTQQSEIINVLGDKTCSVSEIRKLLGIKFKSKESDNLYNVLTRMYESNEIVRPKTGSYRNH